MLQTILEHFRLDAPVTSCQSHGRGHINQTFLVQTQTGRRYILQKIGPAFQNVAALQENIAAVTAHLRSKSPEPYSVMTLIPTREGGLYHTCPDGSNWRMYDFVEGGICLEAPQSPEDFYQSAVAFGRFQQQMADFPAHTLHETIPHFHNTPDRFRIFRETLARDPLGRAQAVREEIEFALDREETAGRLVNMLEAGELPLRVTHNDTKLNNVMLRAGDRSPLCILDLDTTMPGLAAYDFGDAIRYGAATAPEDGQDLSAVALDLELFRLFTRGFLEACPDLTEAERSTLPLGALTITLECGVRFLTDYLDGDRYFAIHYPEQNLHRARTQFRLVADMETKLEQMEAIVAASGKI